MHLLGADLLIIYSVYGTTHWQYIRKLSRSIIFCPNHFLLLFFLSFPLPPTPPPLSIGCYTKIDKAEFYFMKIVYVRFQLRRNSYRQTICIFKLFISRMQKERWCSSLLRGVQDGLLLELENCSPKYIFQSAIRRK